MIKTLFTILIGCIVFAPCLLLFNESGNILPNLFGLLYCLILYTCRGTKVAKTAIYWVNNANKNIESWLPK